MGTIRNNLSAAGHRTWGLTGLALAAALVVGCGGSEPVDEVGTTDTMPTTGTTTDTTMPPTTDMGAPASSSMPGMGGEMLPANPPAAIEPTPGAEAPKIVEEPAAPTQSDSAQPKPEQQ